MIFMLYVLVLDLISTLNGVHLLEITGCQSKASSRGTYMY